MNEQKQRVPSARGDLGGERLPAAADGPRPTARSDSPAGPPRHPSLKIASALLLSAAVALVSLHTPRLVDVPAGSFFPRASVPHTVMLALSLGLMLVLSRGRPGLFGLTVGTYRFSPTILLWVLPMAVISAAGSLALPAGEPFPGTGDLTTLQLFVFVVIYASVGEELLTRGLLQTLLARAQSASASRRGFSMPVVVSALFFGAMHLVLLSSLGPAIVVPGTVLAVFLGLVAGYYREKTGSLIPAVIVHALFNVGGMLALWMIQWLKGI